MYGPIQPDQVLLRTLVEKSWIQNGKPHYSAFQLRNESESGVSLFFSKHEAGVRFGRPIFGFLVVDHTKIGEISLEGHTLRVVQDEPAHAQIYGIPNQYRHNLEKRKEIKKIAVALGRRIADETAVIETYEPNGINPSIFLNA